MCLPKLQSSRCLAHGSCRQDCSPGSPQGLSPMLLSQRVLPEAPSALRDGRDCYRFIFLSDPRVLYPIGAQYLSNSPRTLAQFGAPAGTNRKLLNSVAAEGLAEAAACPCPWLRAEGEAPLQHPPGFFLLFLLKHLASASFHWRFLLHLLLFLAQLSTGTWEAAGRVPGAQAAVLILSQLHDVFPKTPLTRT